MFWSSIRSEGRLKKKEPAAHITAMKMSSPRRVAWFSCGAASAVAAQVTLAKDPQTEVVYCGMFKAEHPDNRRFFMDVEDWLGVRISRIRNDKFSTPEEVFEARKYMSGPKGAPCTVELKKKPRFAYQRPDDIHIFGMTVDEKKRAVSFATANHELSLEWPLIEHGISKPDCLKIIKDAGIEIPAMYRLGYKNNNCPGCVKSTSPKYWNMIRRDFPEKFKHRCEQSRQIGCRLVQITVDKERVRIFLDELADDSVEDFNDDLTCGPQCSFTPEPEEDWI